MPQEDLRLDERTVKFLEQLRPEEVELLKESINFMRSAKTMGRFFKWVLITIVGTFIGAAAFGEAIKTLWYSIRGLSQ